MHQNITRIYFMNLKTWTCTWGRGKKQSRATQQKSRIHFSSKSWQFWLSVKKKQTADNNTNNSSNHIGNKNDNELLNPLSPVQIRTVCFGSQLVGGVLSQKAETSLSSRQLGKSLLLFSAQLSHCRTTLRLFDDLSMLAYSHSYGVGVRVRGNTTLWSVPAPLI